MRLDRPSAPQRGQGGSAEHHGQRHRRPEAPELSEIIPESLFGRRRPAADAGQSRLEGPKVGVPNASHPQKGQATTHNGVRPH